MRRRSRSDQDSSVHRGPGRRARPDPARRRRSRRCRIWITQGKGNKDRVVPFPDAFKRHFLFTWLKTQGIDNALIQPYSGHATRQSLEIYSRLALVDAQQRYDDVIGNFPV